MAEKRVARKELMPLAPTQLKVVTLTCLPLVLGCVVVAVLQTYFFLTSLRSTDAFTTELAQQIRTIAIQVAAIALLVMLPVCFLVAVWLSHRIVGPMRRFAAELDAVGQGRLRGGFHLRQRDELVFVAESLTSMKQQLLSRLATCREALAGADQAAGKAELAQALAQLKERLDSFDIPDEPPSSPDR